jgi:hypothetical protein
VGAFSIRPICAVPRKSFDVPSIFAVIERVPGQTLALH